MHYLPVNALSELQGGIFMPDRPAGSMSRSVEFRKAEHCHLNFKPFDFEAMRIRENCCLNMGLKKAIPNESGMRHDHKLILCVMNVGVECCNQPSMQYIEALPQRLDLNKFNWNIS